MLQEIKIKFKGVFGTKENVFHENVFFTYILVFDK